MRGFRHWISCVLLLGIWGGLSSSDAAPTYYTLSDFQWYVRHADGSKRRTELLSQLSRRQIVVGILWSDTAERDRKLQDVRAFLQQPPAMLPALRTIKPGPSGSHFATYVITTAEDQSLAGVAVLLNTLQGLATFDYALPVLQRSRGPAAPFIEFRAVFLPNAEARAIASFLQRQPVTILSHSGPAYTLRIHTQAATNVLVVIRAFEEATRLVKEVQPIWLDVRASQPVDLATPVPQPQVTGKASPSPSAIEARVTLDTGWSFPLVEVREPVTYRLQIEHSPQVHILPESIAPTALRRALARGTALPSELFDITQASRHTEALPSARLRERVTYTIRVSKPGTYRIPALQIAYSVSSSRRKTQQLQSQPSQGYLLTVDAHLPAGITALPGDVLAPVHLLQRPWPWLQHLALGTLAGGMLAFITAFLLKTPRPRHPAKPKPLSPRQMRQQYQEALQRLHDQMPDTHGPLSPAARVWLRDCATLVRRLLGDWAAGEPTLFTGGAGVSTAMITAHLQETTPEHTTFLTPTLQLLQELDVLATIPDLTLAPEDYQRFSEAVQHTIISLTNHEASRVLRTSHGS
jgi:hypothetical protein